MSNRFKTDEFFLSNICLTSAEELLNPQSFHAANMMRSSL